MIGPVAMVTETNECLPCISLPLFATSLTPLRGSGTPSTDGNRSGAGRTGRSGSDGTAWLNAVNWCKLTRTWDGG